MIAHGADVVVRVGWNAVRWETRDGTPWAVLDAVGTLPAATPGDWAVQIPGTATRPPLPLRLGALRKSPVAAEHARRQARQAAQKRGHPVTAATLAAAVLELYRLRWPIACAFKRLKSLLHRDALRAFDPPRAQTYLLATLLGALLVAALGAPDPDFFPYGYPVRPDLQRRLADYPTDLGRPAPRRARRRVPRRLAARPARVDGSAP